MQIYAYVMSLRKFSDVCDLLGFLKSGRNPHNSFGKVEICP